jgi:hypothetical protein
MSRLTNGRTLTSQTASGIIYQYSKAVAIPQAWTTVCPLRQPDCSCCLLRIRVRRGNRCLCPDLGQAASLIA